ncbi:MAG: tRNA (adenosine(37)-N6)-dimethylallyltransferase MiaA [Thiohalobacterales bacterium]|nr:tRNA (adenosine(37)-N6)-dimethylallyltransferase MiaA [Thiohalobacterales bacterium]
MNTSLPPAVFLMGPTASGKTEVAVELRDHFPFEIISVDSAMVYRGMDIGTAKPDAGMLARAPHRLLDIRDPGEPYSAADFRRDALREMADITRQGRIPLLVGGTLLYFRALEQGLSEMPPADPVLRARLEREAGANGWAALHARLASVDPQAAARIHANDPQRIQRALEVFELTGRPISDFHDRGRAADLPYKPLKLVLAPADRELLQARIAARLRAMLDAGFIDEVRALYRRRDLDDRLPAMRAVGYRQVRAFLAGQTGHDEMVRQAIIATRRYAKRQLTWLRSERDTAWFAAENPDVSGEIRHYLQVRLQQSKISM